MNQPKITVIIPTRERPDVLVKSLQTVTAQDYDNLEIIVSDNFSCDATEDVVRAADDPRVKYINTGKRLSMSHNFEFALSKVTDGWIAVIGDDDGILPNRLGKAVEMVEDSGALALASMFCVYRWPMLKHEGPILYVPMNKGKELRDGVASIRELMKGRTHYQKMPMLYTGGIVHSSLVNAVKRKHGTFFRSCIPDVYSAIAISSVVGRYVYSHEPFAIAGLSGHSTGKFFSGYKSDVAVATAGKFVSEDNISFHPNALLSFDGPALNSLNVLAYESYLQSLHLHDNFPEVTPSQQLEVILIRAGRYKEEIVTWGKAFAEFHQFDFEKVASTVRWSRWPYVASELTLAMRNRVGLFRVEKSLGLRISDVYEASLMAETIIATRPGRFKSVVRGCFDVSNLINIIAKLRGDQTGRRNQKPV